MTVSAPGGLFDPGAGCAVCGRPGPVTVGELDLVTDREQALWAVLDRTETMAVPGVAQYNRRPAGGGRADVSGLRLPLLGVSPGRVHRDRRLCRGCAPAGGVGR